MAISSQPHFSTSSENPISIPQRVLCCGPTNVATQTMAARFFRDFLAHSVPTSSSTSTNNAPAFKLQLIDYLRREHRAALDELVMIKDIPALEIRDILYIGSGKSVPKPCGFTEKEKILVEKFFSQRNQKKNEEAKNATVNTTTNRIAIVEPSIDAVIESAIDMDANVEMNDQFDDTQGEVDTIPTAVVTDDNGDAEEDVDLDEFSDEIDSWVIDELKRIGLDTAKSVLNLSKDELVRRTDLEEETAESVLNVLKKEFE